MSSLPIIQSWDSTDLSIGDRYDGWVQLLNQTFGRWETKSMNSDDFSASVKSSDVGNLKVVECFCDPCAGHRTASTVRQSDEETLAIQLVLSGRESMVLGEQCATLEPGDLFLWDTSQPMTFQVEEKLHKISVVFPLQRFRDWMSNGWKTSPRHIKAGSPTSVLLRSFMMDLANISHTEETFSDSALIEAALALYASRGRNGLSQPSLKASQLEFVKSYIRKHLNDPKLSLSKIAKSNSMSLRNLHWLFEEENQTAWKFVLSERLTECCKDLSNPLMTGRSITDIAFSWGFSDPAYFSKVFKTEFGESPRAFRNRTLN